MKTKRRFVAFFSLLVIMALLLPEATQAVRPSTSWAGEPETPATKATGGLVPLEEAFYGSKPPLPPSPTGLSSRTTGPGLQPLPARTDWVGEIVSLEPGLSVWSGSGALTWEGAELSIPNRGLPLRLALTYDSLYREHDRGWGYGWMLDRDWYYEEDGDDVTVYLGWNAYFFQSDGQGGFIPPFEGITLTRSGPTLILRWQDGREFYFEAPLHRHITRWEDPDDRALFFSYNDAGQLTAVSNGLGRQLTLSYANGRLRTIADEGSTPPRYLELGYSPAGDLITVTDALGGVTRLNYDDAHRLIGVTDSRGGETNVIYEGDYVAQVRQGERRISFLVDKAGGTISIREEGNGGDQREWVYRYDAMGQLESITAPDGTRRSQTWDEVQSQWRTTDENGHTTVYQIEEGHLRAIRNPLGHTTYFSYTPEFFISGITNPNGHTLSFEYDPAGRITAMLNPLGERWSYTYTPEGDLASTTDPLSSTTRFTYDPNGALQVVTNPLGISTRMAYDPAGNLIFVTDGNGHTTAFGYDALGHLTAITDALGHTLRMAYDGNGNLIQATDPNGHITRYGYDAQNRLVVITDAMGSMMYLTYDPFGNPLTLTDAEGRVSHYRYDARDRMTSYTDPLGWTTSFRYDGVGNRIGLTDARGQVITYTFDAADHLTRVDFPDEDDVYYFYDPAGQVTAFGDADIEVRYSYDAAGQVTEVAYTYDGVAFGPLHLGYGYDAAGRRVEVTFPGGQVLQYAYDAASRPVAVSGGETRWELTWDDGDRLTRVVPAAGQAGVQTAYAYDPSDRLISLTNASPDGGVTFDTFHYTYDPAGNVLTSVHNGATTLYAYNPLDWLTGVTYPDGGWETYTYDRVGNRLVLETPSGAVYYAYDAADQLRVMTDTRGGVPMVTTFTYDENGNMRTRTTPAGTITYHWDSADRLVRIDFPDSTFIAYTYGPDGRRLSRRGRDGGTVYYVYDGLKVVEERDSSGNLLAYYLYDPLSDRPYAMGRGGQMYYYLYDRLGSVIGLSDGHGNLVARYEYDPWGNPLFESGAVENPFRYAGREWDAQAGLYYHRARYYDPSLGRFLSRDPMGPVEGTNRYIYAGNNPTNRTDPSGTQSRCTSGSEECDGFCKCFNKCFQEGSIKTALSMIKKVYDWLSKLVIRPKTSGTGSEEETSKLVRKALTELAKALERLYQLLGKAGLLDAGNDCANMASILAHEVGVTALSLATAIATLLAIPTSCGTGLGCLLLVIGVKAAAGSLAVAIAQVGSLIAAGASCTAKALQECKDRTPPTVQVQSIACGGGADLFQVSASDNCELAQDPSGTYPAQGQPRTVTAQDKAGNTASGTIPACRSNCYEQPTCKCGGNPQWNQATCRWECPPILQPDPPECSGCSDPVWDNDACRWTCRERPVPPPPDCGRDRCGRTLRPVWDSRTCSWRCQGRTNNPCLPDDNRSPSGAEEPAMGPPSFPGVPSPAVPSEGLLRPWEDVVSGEPDRDRALSRAGAFSELPPGRRIAILDNGFSISLQNFLARLGFSAERIPPDFSPEVLQRYGVLLVPSGGLSGYISSGLMRERLARYVAGGGVLIVLAQEYGREFGLLPGGGVSGYGYDEDVNCQADSAYLASFAPMLAGQVRERLSLNIDGFFTHWPTETAVILGRMANGMPALLAYRYGLGWVVATTAYPDMADYQGQGTSEERVLLRDLVRWAELPTLDLERHDPNDRITAVLTVTNASASPVIGLRWNLLDPWRRLAASEVLTLPVPLEPGATTYATLTVDLSTLPLPERERYGLWSVDAALLDEAGSTVHETADLFRFAVARFTGQGSGYGYPGQPYTLSVTSDSEEYPLGSPATFTYHVFNHSDREETFHVKWYMIHHWWYSIPGFRGELTVTVPAGEMRSVSSRLERVVDLDRVRASLYLGNRQVAYAERGFWAVPAELIQSVVSDREEYEWGDAPVVTVTLINRSTVPISTSAYLEARSPDGQRILTNTRALSLVPGVSYSYTLTLPPLVQPGHYDVSVQSSAYGRFIAFSRARFYLPQVKVSLEPAVPERLGTGTPITLTVANVGDARFPTSTLRLALKNPAGNVVWADESILPSISPGQVATSTVVLGDPGPISLGVYTLLYGVWLGGQSVATGERVLSASLVGRMNLDRTFYRVREPLTLTVQIQNTGRFDLTPTLALSGPELGLSETVPLSLPVGATQLLTYTFTLSEGLPSGAYPVRAMLRQGGVLTYTAVWVIPPSHLEAALVPGPYQAGEVLTVTLANEGGVDTAADYTLKLGDWESRPVAVATGTRTPAAGSQAMITLTVPAAAARGNYRVLVEGWDRNSGEPFGLQRLVHLSGQAGEAVVRTDRPGYLAGETVRVTGTVTATAGTVSGTLGLRIVRTASGIEIGPNGSINDDLGSADQLYPAIAVDASGNAYAVWLDYRNGDWDIYFAYRPAGGTWGANVRVNDDAGSADQLYPAIAVDASGNAYAVWVDYRNGDSDIYFAYRPAGGTWGANVRVNDDAGSADQLYPAIAVDASGNAYAVWVDDRNGDWDIYFAYRPAGGTWGANVRVNDDAGSADQLYPAIAVDASGNAYAVWVDDRNGDWDIYFAYRPAGGTWGANVRVNDDAGSADQYSPAIAVDASGNAYAVWVDDRNGDYSDIYFAYRPAGGTWGANVRVNDDAGSADQYSPAIAVDTSGNAYAVWTKGYPPSGYGLSTNGGTDWGDIYSAYRPAGGTWGANVRVNDDAGSAYQDYPAIAVDASGNAYAVWVDYRNGDSDIYFAWIIPLGTERVVWRQEVEVHTATTQPISETVGTLFPGKYYLETKLRSAISQTMGTFFYPFYVFPADVALTLETDREVYRSGSLVAVSGRVTNTAVLTATIPLTVTAGEETLLTETFILAPGQGVPYSTSFTIVTDTLLAATAGEAGVAKMVRAGLPRVEAALDAPGVVGRSPFSATLTLTNSGLLSVSLIADFAGQVIRTAVLERNEAALLQASLVLTQSGLLTVTVSGDVSFTLSQAVTQGEVVSLALGMPAGAVWAGPLSLPYTLTNSGLLPSTLPLTFTLDENVVLTRTLTTLAGQVLSDVLWLNIGPGGHTLTAAIPWQEKAITLTAYPGGAADVRIAGVEAPAQLAGPAVLTTTLRNVGPGRVDGTLEGRTAFYLVQVPFGLEPGAVEVLTATLDGSGAPAGGTYTLTVSVWVNGVRLDQVTTTLEVLHPAWQVERPEFTLIPGVENAFPFVVRNVGGLGAPFTLTLNLDGLYSSEEHGWADPGQAVTVTYGFTLPADLEERIGLGRYTFNGVETPFTYTIAGYQLAMSGDLSPQVARSGDLITATIRVTDTSGRGQPIPLRLRLGGVGEPQTRTVTLTGSLEATFVITAPEGSVLLSYGIYHPEGRSLLLDTLRLYVIGELVGVYPERSRYRSGETVVLTATAATSGTLSWYALGMSDTLALLPGQPERLLVPLPGDLPADTYRLMYLFTAEDGRWVQEEVAWEVEGNHVEVREVALERREVGEQEQVTATLRVKSNADLDGVAFTGEVLAPGGMSLVSGTRVVDLPSGHSWVELPPLLFTPEQAGLYRLSYRLSQGGRDLAWGWQGFDVVGPVVVGLNVPRTYYLPTEPVTAGVSLLNEGIPPATLTVRLDGQVVAERVIVERGYRVEVVEVGPLAEGTYTLSAFLTDTTGRDSRGTAEVRVVLPTVQVLLPPPDGQEGWYVTTPHVELWPAVEGSAVYYRWDGGAVQEAVEPPIAVPAEDGRHDLAAWAEIAGGRGPVVTTTLWLDRAAPEVAAYVAPGTPVTVTLVASDLTSGVDWLGYWGDGEWFTYTAPLVFTLAQMTTLSYQARDQAGNVSPVDWVEVPPVSHPYGLALTTERDRGGGAPGTTVAYTLRLTNTGVSADVYTVTLSGNLWPVHGPGRVGPLEAGRGVDLSVMVEIPGDAGAGASDRVTVQAVSRGDPSQASEHTLTTTASVFYGVALEAGRTERTGAPGGQVSYHLRVTNQGNSVDTFDVEVSGNTWPTYAPATVGPLAAGAYAELDVVVEIPPTAEHGQRDEADITVASWGDPTQVAHLNLATTAVAPAPPPVCPFPLLSVEVVGPPEGMVGQPVVLTATVHPPQPTEPVTYTWEPEPLAGQGTAVATYRWAVTGVQVLTVTAENCGGAFTATHTITVSALPPTCPLPLAGVEIVGPAEGWMGMPYTFTAVITPPNATEPVTYTWEPEPLAGQGTAVATYRWEVTGAWGIALTARNCGGSVVDNHTIVILPVIPERWAIYLPLVVKGF